MRLVPHLLFLLVCGLTAVPAEEHAPPASTPAESPAAAAPGHGSGAAHPADSAHGAASAPGVVTADGAISLNNIQALQKLMEGNARYVAGKTIHPHQDSARRAEIAKGQKPFAIVLTCADSRVPPEILFDQGLGDIFVLRVAGNVADDNVQASIEYAVEHLGANLILVLGHERCGAVGAALAGGELPGHLPGLIDRIKPAVMSSRGQPGDALDNAVSANARLVATQLRTSRPLLMPLATRGSLAVLAARLDLDSGQVDILW